MWLSYLFRQGLLTFAVYKPLVGFKIIDSFQLNHNVTLKHGTIEVLWSRTRNYKEKLQVLKKSHWMFWQNH